MSRTTPRVILVMSLAAAAVFWVCAAGAAEREEGPPNGYGLRLGYGGGPQQFVVGAQALLGKRLKYLRFAPSFDAGWGDDVATYVLNLDLGLHVPVPETRSHLYAGAGLGIASWHPRGGGSDTEVGLNLLAGVRLGTKGRMNYTVETRFGVSDVPDFRLLFGVLLGSGRPPAD